MDAVKHHADKTLLPPGSTELGLARSDTSLTIETEYVRMLLELQDIHWLYNFMASLAAWMLLAGYLVIPGTFTSLQRSDTITNKVAQNDAEKAVLKTIQNPPLVAIAWILLVVGVATMSFLFYRWRRNYQEKTVQRSSIRQQAVAVSGVLAASSAGLMVVYKFWKLRIVEEEHAREIRAGIRKVHPLDSQEQAH